MLRKSLLLFLGIAVLAATGVASPLPCCTLEELSRPGSTEVRDCCDRQDCCRVEKRGPAQAALSIKAPEVGVTTLLATSHPQWLVQEAVSPAGALARQPLFEKDHPPPRGGRDTHLRISLLRI